MFPTNFNEAVKSGFAPYIMESFGRDDLVSTKTAKINAIIKDFVKYHKNGYDINSDLIQEKIFKNHATQLSERDYYYIKREVERLLA